MGIVNLSPDSTEIATTVNTLPEAIQEPPKSIFTNLIPENKYISLLKYVEGYPWTVDYYGQIINDNNTLAHFDPSVPNLNQPYYKVIKLILQVSSPLSSNYDNTTGVTTVSGSALTPLKLKPNVGDIFLANIDTNEDALFVVTNVTRKTFRKETLYEIEYNLYAYKSQQPSFLASLEQRVNDTYYFNSDTNFFNRDVLIKPSVKEAIDRLNTFLVESKNYYFQHFYQKITSSICIPGTDNVFHDYYLLEFLIDTCDYNSFYFKKLSLYNFNDISMYKMDTILRNIRQRKKISLNTFFTQKCHFISSSYLNNKVRLGTPYFTNIDFIIAPENVNTNLNIAGLDSYPPENPSFIQDCRTDKNYTNFFNKTIPTINGNKNLIHELFEKNYYIVSKKFYDYINGDTSVNLSFIEFIIYKFLYGEAINKEDLVIAIEDYEQWSLLHQIYLLPVMWHIIKNV